MTVVDFVASLSCNISPRTAGTICQDRAYCPKPYATVTARTARALTPIRQHPAADGGRDVKLFTGQMASFVTALNSALSYSYGRINHLLSKANPIHWIPAARLIGNLKKMKMKEMFRPDGLGLSTALSTGSVD